MQSTASASARSRKSGKGPISTWNSRSGALHRAKFSSKKVGELFARLNANSFVTLVLQAAQVALEEKLVLQAIEDAKTDGDVAPVDTTEITEDPVERALVRNGINTTDRSTLQSVIVGVGEADFSSESKRLEARKVLGMPKPVGVASPYLLLDVRDDEAYKKCRIITALNYPASMIARMFNYESRELVAYKNVPGKLIVFYDDLERDSPRVAATLYERGYDNVYVLTGGLKSLHRAYPEALITGALPVQVLRSSPEMTRKGSRSSRLSAIMARSSSTPSIAKLRISDSKKAGTKWSAYDANGQLKESFGDTELTLLRQRLQHNLLPRMKRNSLTQSTVASKAQMSSSRNTNEKSKSAGSKPWY